jgi:hypothetical protein
MNKFYSLLFIRITVLLLFLGMAGIIILYALGPVVLERVIISRMLSAGLIQPDVRVVAITHKSVHLSRISVQKPRIDIDSVLVSFSFGGLLQGRVDNIFISGLKYHVAFKDNQPDLGLPAPGASSGPTSLVLPFQTIDLRSSSLILNFQGKDYPVPFSSKINIENGHILTFSVQPQLLGLPLFIEGQSNIRTLETGIQARALWSKLPGPGRDLHQWKKLFAGGPRSFDAWLSLEWSMDSDGRGKGNMDIEALANGLRLEGPGFGLGLETGDFSLRAGFDDELSFDHLEADLSLSGLSFNDKILESLNISLLEMGSVLEFSTRLIHPAKALFEAGGKQSSINELLEGDFEYFADFEWEMRCELDQDQVRLLSPVEVNVAEPLEAFAFGRFKADFSARPEADGDNWSLRVTGEKARTSLSSMYLPDLALGISGLEFEAPFFVEAGPGSIKGGLLENSRLGVKEASIEQNSEKYVVKGLDFKNQPGNPFMFFELVDGGFAGLSWRVEQDGLYEAGFTGVSMLGQGLKLKGEIHRDTRGSQKADIMISPEITLLSLHDPGLKIRDIYLDLPFILGDVEAKPGDFSIDSISYSDIKFPGMTGLVIIDNYKATAQGEWLFLPGAELDFSADVLIDQGKGVIGKINAHSNWFDFPEKEIIDSLVPALKDVTINGSARAQLDLDLGAATIQPVIQIDIRDAGVVYPGMDMEASGLSGSMVIDDFFPLTTPGNQRIDISKFRIGQLELVDGFLAFRLESPERVFLEKTRWSLPEGGFLAAHASRFNLQDLSADFEIFFEDVDLLQFVSRLSEEKIVGSGLVYGRVPVLYEKERVTIGRGYLYSVPGKGRLGIRDEEWLEVLLLYVRDAMKGHPYLSLVSERLEQALRDFEYDFLAVNLVPGPEDTSARIEIRGRGVEGDPPQEVGSLVVNVNDLGEIVNRVLRFQLTKDESIERALEDLLGF